MAPQGAVEECGYEETREGTARLLVPRLSCYQRPDGVYEPAWAPVFYNPRMAFNRDIAVVFARAYARLRGLSRLVVVEPLAGTGVRVLRYVLEADAWAVVNDVDPKAVKLIEQNLELNNVRERVSLHNLDANELLASMRRRGVKPTIIDLDPFGSPAPFLDAAVKAIRGRGVIAATATDTAPLSGTHPRALRRRYDVVAARTAWEKEQAVRILAGYIIRRAASHEYSARILLAYYADYYVRVYVELVRGAGRADASLEQLSYGYYCPGCGLTGYMAKPGGRCPLCAAPLLTVGPLYSGPLCDEKLLQTMIEEAEKLRGQLAQGSRVVEFLKRLSQECSITKPYYRVDKLCSILRTNMPSPRLVAGLLAVKGYKAAPTLFDPRGVKTDAPHWVIVNTILELAPH